MTLDEFFASEKSSDNVRIVAAVLLTLVSIAGGILNTLVLVAVLLRTSNKDGFLKICCVKSFGNNVVCFGYLVWPIPVTFLNDYFLPHMFNAFMGQLVGWFGWSISPLTQVLLTSNRVFAVFFPYLYQRNYKYSPSNIGIAICLILATLLFLAFFPEDCHYLYNLSDIGWLPEESFCTSVRRQIFIISMIIIVIVTSICCVLIFLRLVSDTFQKSVHMTSTQSSNRLGKQRRILFQTLVQNFLILADTLNTTVTYKIFPVFFFQFLTLSFSMVFLRALEGLVMLTMNERISKGVRSIIGMKPAEASSIRAHSMVFNVSSTSPKHMT